MTAAVAVLAWLVRLRRFAAARWPLWVALATLPLLAAGIPGGRALAEGDLLAIGWTTILGAAVLRALGREIARPADLLPPAAAALQEVELSVVLVAAAFLLPAVGGAHRESLYPLLYALVSFLTIVLRSKVAPWLSVAAAFAFEAAVARGTGSPPAVMAEHMAYLGFFALGNLLVLRGVVERVRRHHEAAVGRTLERIRREARDFRLIAAQLPLSSRPRGRDEEETFMVQAAVESIHDQLFHQLDLLKVGLGLHTCALLWVRDLEDGPGGRRSARLVLKEAASDSEALVPAPDLSGPGILAAVVRAPKPLRLAALGGRRVPPYYEVPDGVTDLCAVPLMDGGALRGILCADRTDDRPFTDDEVAVLVKAADHMVRIVEQERVFAAVERGKYEQEQFYRASERLNEALTLADVYAKTFEALAAIAPFDLAVLTGCDGPGGTHRVLAVRAGEGAGGRWAEVARRLEDHTFDGGRGLVAMAVKNRHHMPADPNVEGRRPVVFDEDTVLPGARSLLVLPLVRGETVLGTLVLASEQAGRYGPATREMLKVIGHQVGVSLQNARMYQAMEERATTDGLTGLTNHRAFQERLAGLHALAERTGQKFSVILTDIDHFKSINDTYGHPVGDQVLRRVAALFAGRARKVDIVARYGGEEFVLVLPDTDGAGAAHFANKLREEVAAQTMTSEHGSFQVTISMGIAEFPADGRDPKELVRMADEALYHSKESGRNRVTRYAEMAR